MQQICLFDVKKMSLFTIFGTDVMIIDLVVPFLDNKSILTLTCVHKTFVKYRKIVVKQRYSDRSHLFFGNDINRTNHTKIKCFSKEIGDLNFWLDKKTFFYPTAQNKHGRFFELMGFCCLTALTEEDSPQWRRNQHDR